MKYAPLIPIDLDKVNTPWNSKIAWISSPDRLPAQKEIPPLEAITFCHRVHILHWLVKLKWNSKHRTPYTPKGHKETYKPLGELYKRVLNTCMECHLLDLGSEYNTPAEWFRLILFETSVEGQNLNDGKDETVKKLQRGNRELAGLSNPFNPTAEPHAYRLAQAALAVIDGGNDVFLKEVWRPLVKARQAWVRELRSERWQSMRHDGTHWFLQSGGGGKNQRKIPPLKNGVSETPSP
jgi:hypothetical protein